MRQWKRLMLAVFCLLLVSLTFACSDKGQPSTVEEGSLPVFCIGDKWVSKLTRDGIDYERHTEVIGEDVVDGLACYIVQSDFEPPINDIFSSSIAKYDKATMDLVWAEMYGESEGLPVYTRESVSYEYSGDPEYPLMVGRESSVTEFAVLVLEYNDETQTNTETSTYTTRVEKIEDITVPAGTFRCFKKVKYDAAGTEIRIIWVCDNVKLVPVKLMNLVDGTTEELLSYSVSSPAAP